MFHHQSLFFFKYFDSSNRLNESSENIFFQFFTSFLLSPEIFFMCLDLGTVFASQFLLLTFSSSAICQKFYQ
jgi:hypothetical protein